MDFGIIKQILEPELTSISILAEGYFDSRHAKTALGVIRYGKYPIHSVIDSSHAGKTIKEVTGIDCISKIYSSLQESIRAHGKPKALLLGIAPQGGNLPDNWMNIIEDAIKAGIHIINGLHVFLNDNLELRQLASLHDVILWDVRDPNIYPASASNSVAMQKLRPAHTKVITMVGSDCNVGKMTVALELDNAFKKQNIKSKFIATGQTGIMIAGDGIPLDRIIGDFMAGSIENIIGDSIQKENPEYILVEGQGSLLHPGYSGVTMSLIHGSNPEMMILCSKPDNQKILGGYEIEIPSFTSLIEIYQNTANLVSKKNAKVIGIAINTSNYSDKEAKDLVSRIESETKLPVTDPIRFGVNKLMEAIKNYAN